MKKENCFGLVLIPITIALFLIFLCYPFDLNSIVIIISIILLLIALPIIIWETAYFHIKDNEIQIKHINNKRVQLYYKDYKIDCTLDQEKISNMIPNKDMNNKVIKYIDRNRLNNYLLKNYDNLSISDNFIPVYPENIMREFKDFTLCDDNIKNKFITEKNFSGIIIALIALLIFIIIELKDIITIYNQTKEISKSAIIIFVIALIFIIVVISSILRKTNNQKQKKLYCKKVKIFDKKMESCGEEYSYKVRVGDDENHILTQWFYINKKEYDICSEGLLYVLTDDNNNDLFFELNK